MTLFEKIKSGDASLSLIGLGYVGLPIAVAFAKEGVNVIGFDLNAAKIDLYKAGVDPTNEVGAEQIRKTTVRFTADERSCKRQNSISLRCPPRSIRIIPRIFSPGDWRK